jgi:hypothetical protein
MTQQYWASVVVFFVLEYSFEVQANRTLTGERDSREIRETTVDGLRCGILLLLEASSKKVFDR